jgi:cleavage and polyadenylation specificity factor subunit 1
MIVSKASADESEVSDVYALTEAGFEALTGTEFEPAAGSTVEAGTLGNGMRVIQILKSEVRSYDGSKSPLSLQAPFIFRRKLAMTEGLLSFMDLKYLASYLLPGELSGDASCPIASMKAFILTPYVYAYLPFQHVLPALCV